MLHDVIQYKGTARHEREWAGPYGLTPTTVTLSGSRSLSCSVLGIGILRVSNVSGAEIGGLSLNAELVFTGWS